MRDALPNASFIGFTGTPIEQNDANTRAVFGEYVSVDDIQQAVIDKATVPIYYESRIAKLSLNEAELPKVDSEFEEITAGEEEDRQQKLKTKWAALEALVGSEKRIRLIAESGNGLHRSDCFLSVAARLPRCSSLKSHEFSETKKSGSRVKMIYQSKPDARVVKLRCFGFTPQRGSPK